MSYLNRGSSFLAVAPLAWALGGCSVTTLLLDKFDAAAVGQPPAPPTTGTSTSSGGAVTAADPHGSQTDHWLKLARTGANVAGGEYIGTFTQNVTNKKASVDLVGFVPNASKIMMTVFFEPKPPAPPAPLLHIDLHPDGKVFVNDAAVGGTFKFDTLVGFFVNFDLTGSAPNASILIRGGDADTSVTVPIPKTAANFGLGRVRIVAPFEGVNAPNGFFLANDVIATTPN